MPLFALANAGVELGGGTVRDAVTSPVALGVALGLAVGKPAGILLFSWLAVRTGAGALPEGTSWRLLGGASVVAGIGFTISLFIGDLAFRDAAFVDEAKMGVLAASVVMGGAGYVLLRVMSKERAVAPNDAPTSRPL